MTLANQLTLVRLVAVIPVMAMLYLPYDWARWAALGIYAFAVLTDWLDGKLARLLDQYSAVGALLDPAVDRLYILAALVALGVRDIVPWWAVAVLVGRDAVLAVCLVVLRARGFGPFRVTYLGKSATFLLLYAFPLLLLGDGPTTAEAVVRVVGYAFAGWGVALYLWTRVSRVALFWAAVILTRPLGATVGDFLDKPVAHGGLDLSRPLASLAIAILIIVAVLLIPQRPGRHPGAEPTVS